jgi:hypothetical protein
MQMVEEALRRRCWPKYLEYMEFEATTIFRGEHRQSCPSRQETGRKLIPTQLVRVRTYCGHR